MQADCDRANDSFSNPGVLVLMWIFHLSFLNPINSKGALAWHTTHPRYLHRCLMFKYSNFGDNCVNKMK